MDIFDNSELISFKIIDNLLYLIYQNYDNFNIVKIDLLSKEIIKNNKLPNFKEFKIINDKIYSVSYQYEAYYSELNNISFNKLNFNNIKNIININNEPYFLGFLQNTTYLDDFDENLLHLMNINSEIFLEIYLNNNIFIKNNILNLSFDYIKSDKNNIMFNKSDKIINYNIDNKGIKIIDNIINNNLLNDDLLLIDNKIYDLNLNIILEVNTNIDDNFFVNDDKFYYINDGKLIIKLNN